MKSTQDTRARELQGARQMLDFVANKTTDLADEQYQVPVKNYVDPVRWDREVDEIFKKKPIVVAFSAEIRLPKSYKALEIVGVPLLITRGMDGVARTFLNVCRHRGAIVAPQGCGSSKNFSCPYHGWTFNLKGQLIGVAEEGNFGAVERAELGLKELPTVERGGMVYAVLTPGARLDLDDWLGSLDPIIEDLDLDKCHFFSEASFSGPNWKLAMDGYLENYHFDALHKNTFSTFIVPGILGVNIHGNHMEHLFCSPTIESLRDEPEELWEPRRHVGVALQMFPNSIVGFLFEGAGEEVGYKGRLLQIERVFPGDTPNESITIQTILSSEPLVNAEHISFAQAAAKMGRTAVETEDYKMGKDIQRAIGSGANESFTFGRNEMGLHHFHRTIDRMLSLAN